MAAGEDEAQPVVLDLVVVDIRLFCRLADAPEHWRERCVERRAPAQPVDRLEATRRYEPRSRIVRNAIRGPARHCGRERILHGLLGKVEIAEEADERGQDAARVRSVELLDPFAHDVRLSAHVSYIAVNSMIGRISTEP